MNQKSFATVGLVIKRSNSGEADKVVTLLTQDQGKLVCIAKGVRTIKSSKRAYLEPGNSVKVFCVNTSGLPILTQASLITDAGAVRTSLAKIRQLTQILELFDRLFVEGEADIESYLLATRLRDQLLETAPSHRFIQDHLGKLLVSLGYQHPTETPFDSVLEYVSHLSEQKMRSFEYLRVKS